MCRRSTPALQLPMRIDVAEPTVSVCEAARRTLTGRPLARQIVASCGALNSVVIGCSAAGLFSRSSQSRQDFGWISRQRFEQRPSATTRLPCSRSLSCAPGRIRTSDTRFRKPMLYPLSYGSTRPSRLGAHLEQQASRVLKIGYRANSPIDLPGVMDRESGRNRRSSAPC